MQLNVQVGKNVKLILGFKVTLYSKNYKRKISNIPLQDSKSIFIDLSTLPGNFNPYSFKACCKLTFHRCVFCKRSSKFQTATAISQETFADLIGNQSFLVAVRSEYCSTQE